MFEVPFFMLDIVIDTGASKQPVLQELIIQLGK